MEDTGELVRPRVAADGMYDGEGELTLCEILTKALVICILLEGKSQVRMYEVQERDSFPFSGQHQLASVD